jgi:NAD(P)-dependent dehydrogenase (short-subunit alcohol dehydrogenase family)
VESTQEGECIMASYEPILTVKTKQTKSFQIAEQIEKRGEIWMKGKICMVTGANSGIGKATASGLAKMGATVIMVCRDPLRGEEARLQIIQESGNPLVELLLVDLSSQQDIRRFVAEFSNQYNQLDVLINNAGGMFTERKESKDGIEMNFALNYLSVFLLTQLLLDSHKLCDKARIINVASMAQTKTVNLEQLIQPEKFKAFKAYGDAKLAVVLYTYSLSKLLIGKGMTVNALHPGVVYTQNSIHSIPQFFRPLYRSLRRFMMTPEQGAANSIYLATSPDVEGISGKYYKNLKPVQSVPISYNTEIQDRLNALSIKWTEL